jgi:hypothetical protein
MMSCSYGLREGIGERHGETPFRHTAVMRVGRLALGWIDLTHQTARANGLEPRIMRDAAQPRGLLQLVFLDMNLDFAAPDGGFTLVELFAPGSHLGISPGECRNLTGILGLKIAQLIALPLDFERERLRRPRIANDGKKIHDGFERRSVGNHLAHATSAGLSSEYRSGLTAIAWRASEACMRSQPGPRCDRSRTSA